MLDSTFQATVFDRPFARAIAQPELRYGASVSDIIAEADIPKSLWPYLRVVISKDGRQSEVSITAWRGTYPRPGVHVEIFPMPQGGVVAALLSAVVASAAPAIAGFLFPTLTGTALALVTAGITIVGQLLVSALIPPPTVAPEEEARFSVDGINNLFERYSPYPKPLGRRRMAPKATATGYTEIFGDDLFFVGRYAFGFGPLALEDLRIGETPITEFEGVEIEFLNVDEAETLARIPALGLSGRTIVSASAVHGSVEIIDGTTLRYTSNFQAGDANLPVPGADGFISDVITYQLSGGATEYTATVKLAKPYRVRVGRTDAGDIYETRFDRVQDVELASDSVSVVGWRQGTERMQLYRGDIFQEDFSVEIAPDVPVVRLTQNDTARAAVDLTFQGLGWRNDKNQPVNIFVDVRFRYRAVGQTEWIDAGTERYEDKTLELVRFSKEIEFPAVGQYEIEILRLNAIRTHVNDVRETPILTAIKSVQDGDLPSHAGVAEIAVRIRATGQLNGRLATLNATVLQLGRVWDGVNWSGLKPIRHPAWVLYDLVSGPSMKEPFDPLDIDLDSLRNWSEQLPWATCDYLLNGTERAEEAIRLVAATGLAFPAMNDLKFGVIVDGGNGPRVQSFSPSNASAFELSNAFPSEVHAFRCQVASERLNWQTDEVLVYADGYAATDGPGVQAATKFEELPLPGVVLTKLDGTQANAWRHGRYHLAVAKLRPLRLSFTAGLDNLRAQRGDKVGITYDGAALGVGSGRVRDLVTDGVTISEITLDDDPTQGAGTYRLRLRAYNGSDVSAQANCVSPSQWQFAEPIARDLVDVGDLVFIEEPQLETADFLLVGAEPEFDEAARLEAVLAAPEVLLSYEGAIPDYEPNISGLVAPVSPREYGPALPTIIGISSDAATLIREKDGSVKPAIRVEFAPDASAKDQPVAVELRYKLTGSAQGYRTSERVPFAAGAVSTAGLDAGENYTLIFVAIGESGAVSQRFLPVTQANDLGPPAKITNYGFRRGPTNITLVGPAPSERDVSHINIYAATDANADLTKVGQTPPGVDWVYIPEGGFTRYKVAAEDFSGNEGELSDFIDVVPLGVAGGDLDPGLEDRLTLAEVGLVADYTDIDGSTYISGLRAKIDQENGGGLTSVLELLGDNVIAPGSLSVGSLTVGLGKNLIRNSDFRNGLTNWRTNTFNTTANEWSMVVRAAGLSWSGRTFPVLSLRQDGASPDGGIYAETAGDDGSNRALAVHEGHFYEFNVRVSSHRCTGRVELFFRDQGGLPVGAVLTVDVPEVLSSADNPSLWPIYTVRGVAPAGAMFASCVVRKYATFTGANSFIFIHHPVFGETHENASEPLPYSDGIATKIDGGNVIAETLDVQTALVGKTVESAAQIDGVPVLQLDFLTGLISAQGVFVGGENIAENATAEAQFFQEAGAKSVTTTTSFSTVMTQDVTTEGGGLLVGFTDNHNGRRAEVRLLINGTAFTYSDTGVAQVPAGTHTLEAQVVSAGSTSTSTGGDRDDGIFGGGGGSAGYYSSPNRSLAVIELKQAT